MPCSSSTTTPAGCRSDSSRGDGSCGSSGGPRNRLDELRDAERRILRLLATDLTLRDIGRELYVSLNTVKTHTRAIYRKLDVSSRSEAVRAGTERGELRLTERSDSPG